MDLLLSYSLSLHKPKILKIIRLGENKMFARIKFPVFASLVMSLSVFFIKRMFMEAVNPVVLLSSYHLLLEQRFIAFWYLFIKRMSF